MDGGKHQEEKEIRLSFLGLLQEEKENMESWPRPQN